MYLEVFPLVPGETETLLWVHILHVLVGYVHVLHGLPVHVARLPVGFDVADVGVREDAALVVVHEVLCEAVGSGVRTCT